MAWNQERLLEVARDRLGGARLVVVSNREPVIHDYRDGAVVSMRPASGLTTALEPVVHACGGTWVAHGSGAADRAAADKHGRVRLPAEAPAYTLRRVWLSPEEESGYYYGLSNETLWPLCHVTHQRPAFDPAAWAHYRRVNRQFAAAVLDELAGRPGLVFVQDYHFALLPRLLKAVRPDLVVAHFWHIPWPHREAFRICPWQGDLLDGLLGNDLLAFHLQEHCNNFLETVDRTLEARVDWAHFAVTRGGRTTHVRPHPISIDPDQWADQTPAATAAAQAELRRRLGLQGEALLVGVERVDYTKGLPERLRAFDRLLERRGDLKGKVTLVQVGAPSRTAIAAYRRLGEEVAALAEAVNRRHGTAGWRPVVYVNEHFGPAQVHALYRMAAVGVVSSLHDGMNLVAKEFVAARADLRGVLVLSQFAGAARELPEALAVNPYDVDGFARALQEALVMPAAEQERRLRRMRRQVAEHNVYRWAGKLLTEAAALLDRAAEPADYLAERPRPNDGLRVRLAAGRNGATWS
jgi:trehalose 6-phosphate synthase